MRPFGDPWGQAAGPESVQSRFAQSCHDNQVHAQPVRLRHDDLGQVAAANFGRRPGGVFAEVAELLPDIVLGVLRGEVEHLLRRRRQENARGRFDPGKCLEGRHHHQQLQLHAADRCQQSRNRQRLFARRRAVQRNEKGAADRKAAVPPSVGWISNTGATFAETTCWAMLPKSNLRMPPRPWVHITTKSDLNSRACSAMEPATSVIAVLWTCFSTRRPVEKTPFDVVEVTIGFLGLGQMGLAMDRGRRILLDHMHQRHRCLQLLRKVDRRRHRRFGKARAVEGNNQVFEHFEMVSTFPRTSCISDKCSR